jgi:hypothetical protein
MDSLPPGGQFQRSPLEAGGVEVEVHWAHKHAANMRAKALSAVIQNIRAAGFISYNSVARELNQRRVPTLRH